MRGPYIFGNGAASYTIYDLRCASASCGEREKIEITAFAQFLEAARSLFDFQLYPFLTLPLRSSSYVLMIAPRACSRRNHKNNQALSSSSTSPPRVFSLRNSYCRLLASTYREVVVYSSFGFSSSLSASNVVERTFVFIFDSSLLREV